MTILLTCMERFVFWANYGKLLDYFRFRCTKLNYFGASFAKTLPGEAKQLTALSQTQSGEAIEVVKYVTR